jgi:hypothetical protein
MMVNMDSLFKDMYAQPGQRLKQWVVDQRRESKWENETCPKVSVPQHDDNTGASCRNGGDAVPWTYLSHDCCGLCEDFGDEAAKRDDVIAWRAEKAKRPPIETDHSKLSDEVQADYGSFSHPLMAMLGHK